MENFGEWLVQKELQEGLLRTAAKVATYPVRKMWNGVTKIYGKLSVTYGKGPALAILALSLGLQTIFPPLAAIPGSLAIGTIPGIVTADAVKYLRGQGDETLIAEGVRFLRQRYSPEQIKSMAEKTRNQIIAETQTSTT